MMPIFTYQKLIGHIDGTSVSPPPTVTVERKAIANPALLPWTEEDHRAVILLQSSLTEEAAYEVFVSLLLAKYGYLLKLRRAMLLLNAFTHWPVLFDNLQKVHPLFLIIFVDSKQFVTSSPQSVIPLLKLISYTVTPPKFDTAEDLTRFRGATGIGIKHKT